MGKVLTFLHLSDIHFHKGSESVYCPDSDIRNEMLIDVKELKGKENLKICGIIVCGDVAYSGKEEEYKIAASFIEELIKKLDMSAGCVYCVPGNHDVDQSFVEKSVALYAVQKLLEHSDENQMGDYLLKLQDDPYINSKDFLYSSIKSYNEFAKQYASAFTMDAPNWCQKIRLNEKFTLAIYGMNSTLISNQDDHKEAQKDRLMHLGKNQLPQREKNTIYMTVCHHPPTDWKDKDMGENMGQRAMIQLYGHKHVQSIKTGEQSVVIGTGALQPNRNEDGWQPRYNFLSVQVIDNELKIKIYPRVWDERKLKFKTSEDECDSGKIYKEIILPIENKENDAVDHSTEDSAVHIMNANERKFIHLFMRKSKRERKQLLLRYPVFSDLIDENGRNIDTVLEQIVKRAIDNAILEEMNHILETTL